MYSRLPGPAEASHGESLVFFPKEGKGMKALVNLGWLSIVALLMVTACNGGADNGDVVTDEPVVVSEPAIPPPFNFTISGECQAVIKITELSLVRGQTVTYCNEWAKTSTLKFDVPGLLPGGATQRDLTPGECVTHTITTDVATGTYSWSLTCVDYTGPSGGGPVKVVDPPPTEP